MVKTPSAGLPPARRAAPRPLRCAVRPLWARRGAVVVMPPVFPVRARPPLGVVPASPPRCRAGATRAARPICGAAARRTLARPPARPATGFLAPPVPLPPGRAPAAAMQAKIATARGACARPLRVAALPARPRLGRVHAAPESAVETVETPHMVRGVPRGVSGRRAAGHSGCQLAVRAGLGAPKAPGGGAGRAAAPPGRGPCPGPPLAAQRASPSPRARALGLARRVGRSRGRRGGAAQRPGRTRRRGAALRAAPRRRMRASRASRAVAARRPPRRPRAPRRPPRAPRPPAPPPRPPPPPPARSARSTPPRLPSSRSRARCRCWWTFSRSGAAPAR
jgi:hypothetical protein